MKWQCLGIGLNKDHNEEQYMTGANLLFVQCGDVTIIRTIDDWSQLVVCTMW